MPHVNPAGSRADLMPESLRRLPGDVTIYLIEFSA